MAVPTHSPNCSTRTFQTTCQDCGATVHYFACNCGSKVFFDRLGGAWPLHADSCLPYLVRLNLEEGFRSIEEIRELVTETSETLGIAIPENVNRLLGFAERVRNNRLRVSTIAPCQNIATIDGTIISVTPQVNIYRHFDLDDGNVGRALLGNLVNAPLAKVTIREEPDANNNCREFEVFIPRDWIAQQGLHANTNVHLSINMRSIIGRSSIWYGSAIIRQ
jgi:hypothetical protein